MKRFILIALTMLTIGLWIAGDLWARGGGGGGRGGGGGGRGGGGGARAGGGGGGARAAAGRTPSMSRPSGGGGYGGSRPGGGSRPSYAGGARPGGGGGGQFNRPSGSRPSIGNLPSPNRPGSGISRPGGGGGTSRPSIAGGGGARPGGGQPGFSGRPSQGQLNDFLDLGGAGSRPSINRPSTFPGGAGGQVAGNAAYDFLRDRPSGGGGRPSTLPATRPGGRPGTGDLAGGGRPGRPGDGLSPGDGNRPGRPGGGDGGRPGRPGDGDNRPGRPGDRPGRPGDRPDWANRPNSRPDRNPNWNQSQNWRHNQWSNVNNYWNNNWNHYGRYFNNDWCHHHPYWHWRPGFNYWGWATWAAVANWFPWGYSEPVYYNYGSNVYYQDDMVYYGTTPVASAEDYANQAEAIAANVPATPPPADSWMPLGVFSVMPDGEAEGAEPTIFLQLTVSKEGVIAGTMQNTLSGTTKNIEGMVDKASQRAAWTEVGQTRPIMETGIGNLTQDTTPVLVHYADGTTQQWLLVRMDQPKTGAGGATGGASAVPPQ